MSLNTGSIVVVNAFYTYRLIGPNSQGVKCASLNTKDLHGTGSNPVKFKKKLNIFIGLFYSLLLFFYSVDVAFVLNTTINSFSVI